MQGSLLYTYYPNATYAFYIHVGNIIPVLGNITNACGLCGADTNKLNMCAVMYIIMYTCGHGVRYLVLFPQHIIYVLWDNE